MNEVLLADLGLEAGGGDHLIDGYEIHEAAFQALELAVVPRFDLHEAVRLVTVFFKLATHELRVDLLGG